MGNLCSTDAGTSAATTQQHTTTTNTTQQPKQEPTKKKATTSSPVDQVMSMRVAPSAAAQTAASASQQQPPKHHLKNVFAKPLQFTATYQPPVYPKTSQQEEFIQQAISKNVILHPNSSKAMILAFEAITVEQSKIIIEQGDVGDYFYIIEKGKVQFQVNGTVVGHATRGSSFGELSLLYTSPRAATCVAETACTLWRLDQETFRFILQQETTKADTEKHEILKQIDFLQDLDEADLNKLTKVLCPRSFEAKEHLVKKGQAGEAFFIIAKGTVDITDITVGDAKFQNQVLGPGDYFGERALVTKEPRAAHVYGKTAGVCWTVDGDTFQSVVGPLSQLVLKAQDKRVLGSIETIANSHLESTELVALADLIVDKKYKKGTTLLQEGRQVPATLFLVREGKIQVTSDSFKEYEGTFGKGGFVGQDALLVDQGGIQGDATLKAKYTITVLENATLGELRLLEARDVVDTTKLGLDKSLTSSTSMAALHNISSPKELDKHTILGAGTFGQVWLVTYKKKKTPYALKVQSKYELVQQSQAKGVVNEKNIMQKLDSPFIIKMMASFQDPALIYILLKLVQGGELYSVLHTSKRDGVPESSAKFYAAGILEGLSYMHRRHILYRDLKPENVLVDKDGYPVIIDLGFAKVVRGKTFTLCGTPLYIAPEVILNRGHDKGVDHWSLGVLIFEMITGYTPFYQDGMEQMELFRAIINAKFDAPPKRVMSAEADSIVRQFLVKDPHHRLGSLAKGIKEIFAHKWFESLDFDAYRRRQVAAPWKPKIKDPLDSSNFDSWEHLKDKTKQKDPPLSAKDQAVFKGF